MAFDTTEHWRQKISKYKNESWAQAPSIFVQQDVIPRMPESGRVLELGCGLGSDGLWLSDQGYIVTQSDVADFREEKAKVLPFIEHNLNNPLQLTQSFDVVYSHLALHYFSYRKTEHLFKEIYNSLNVGGVFAFIVNSVDDPEYGTGNKIEDDYFEIEGQPKRFFDISTAKSLCQDFEMLLIDNKGTTHKDMAKNVHNLVRVVCKKR